MMQLESMCLSTNPKHHIPLNGTTNMILYTCSCTYTYYFFVNLCMPSNCSSVGTCAHTVEYCTRV